MRLLFSNFFNLYAYFDCRYSNVYCAQCNGARSVKYWRVDVGCVKVDDCGKPIGIQTSQNVDFNNLVKELRSDPTIATLETRTE